ncbi:MAG: hypothetical protein UV59_C0015G0005 [Candidatus Gottesmanbacteria bacterium GW2011_GWA1_43_11]|uniref:Uncharacterized protein n=1 Tax=Candidatus Gottesmanbacteria bacterium GW2011_GWA1_43_11 TaxID=1618436 RepID=A0A0G1CGN3_9BACT|nr:MAG: hypothetical protein UV59_C0015G0005 [Candidatus Gottesmanbacteria bacterium GW2011_GWA1_43_11]
MKLSKGFFITLIIGVVSVFIGWQYLLYIGSNPIYCNNVANCSCPFGYSIKRKFNTGGVDITMTLPPQCRVWFEPLLNLPSNLFPGRGL